MTRVNLDTTKEHLGRLSMFNARGETEVEILVDPTSVQVDPLKASTEEQNKLLGAGYSITYTAPQVKPAQQNWYVISGFGPDGRRYYLRRWYFADRVVSIEFHYQPDIKPMYDKIIPDMTLKGINIYDTGKT
jgi:hypothetical protein